MKQLLQEGFPQLYKMQQTGLIKAYGIGTNEVLPCIQALSDSHIKLLLLAGRGTLLCNGAPQSTGLIRADGGQMPELIKTLKSHPNHPKLVAASIANSGIAYGGTHYNYKPADKSALEFRDKINAAIGEYNVDHRSQWTMKDLLIHYPLDHLGDAVASVMPGPGNIEEFEDTARTFRKEVPRDLWNVLMRKGLLNPELQLTNDKNQPTS
jgi:aryl-alcohol dehydrogenase-like predicted oxidoreductase